MVAVLANVIQIDFLLHLGLLTLGPYGYVNLSKINKERINMLNNQQRSVGSGFCQPPQTPYGIYKSIYFRPLRSHHRYNDIL